MNSKIRFNLWWDIPFYHYCEFGSTSRLGREKMFSSPFDLLRLFFLGYNVLLTWPVVFAMEIGEEAL
jgi:hypothetical protein